ncbi:glutamate-rich WD repeat-containing protein 1 [Trichonephila clavipes]|nr:glutamate-rich WD repeat-containing protein 1 [Trichonephila clavipes]
MANEEYSNDEKDNVDNEMDVVEESSNDDEEVDTEASATSRVYLPSAGKKDEELEYDESAYVFYYAVRTGSPCLSFDIIPDNLGDNRADQFPLSMTLVGGTEVKNRGNNNLLIMKLSNMQKTKTPKSDDESDSDSDSDEITPDLEALTVRHMGCVNRVKRTNLGGEPYAASWSELGKVHIWNLSQPVSAVNNSQLMVAYKMQNETVEPTFTFSGHQMEGFSMEWSPLITGVLATGDCKSSIHVWKPLEGGSWHVDQRPYKAHTDSVEDIAWSPNESNVMASCSVDKSIRIWDIRAPPNKACMLTKADAHDSDVNVISWNKSGPFILSGGDDGKLRVWDLKQFPSSEPVCTFKYHTAPITSVEWHPTDNSVFAAASSDDLLTQWDVAVERDESEEEEQQLRDIPAQLLFIHQGQKEIKELHWHPQMPGVLISTAQEGLNVFRTISI